MKLFDWKSFVSFGLFVSFLVISVSGVVLYIAPPGRVARWVDWELWRMSLGEWQALHTNFSYLFILLALVHLCFMNWKVFWSYVKKKAAAGLHRKWEIGAGLLLFVVVFAGTLYKVPPLQTIMDIGGDFSSSWLAEEDKAPVPHTEALTIGEVAEKLVKEPPQVVIDKLERAGFENISPDKTLKQMGEESGKSPLEIFRIISR